MSSEPTTEELVRLAEFANSEHLFRKVKESWWSVSFLWQPHRSLDQMAEIRAPMTDEQKHKYMSLLEMKYDKVHVDWWKVLDAPADVLCRVALEVIS